MRRIFHAAAALAIVAFVCGPAGSETYHKKLPAGGEVTGQVIIKGKGPMLGGTVFFIDEAAGFLPSLSSYWLVPSYTVPLDDNTSFRVRLPEGTYYVGAIERESGEVLGPPEEGDYFFLGQDAKGNPKKLGVWNNAKIDLGTLENAAPFQLPAAAPKGMTTIRGTIKDVLGRTVGGMTVAAYIVPDMKNKPLFLTRKTAIDGKYQLRVPKGGTYYLVARGQHGDLLLPDELIGFYKDGKPVKVTTGSTKNGIDITVLPVKMLDGSSPHPVQKKR